MTDSEINIILDRLKFGKNYGELFNMDFVIDAVCETSNLKHEIISILEEVIRPDAIIARLTPKVDFNIFPEQIKDPSRLIIFNFLSLCHNIKLLELIITTSASPDVLATGFSFGKKIQKITVPVLFEGGPIEPPPVCRRLQSKYGWSLWKKVTEPTDFQLRYAPARFG